MRITGKLTTEGLNDVRKMVQSKWRWPKLIMRNWYGVTLLGVITYFSIDGVVRGAKVNWNALGIVWAIVATIFGWAYFSARRAMAKEFTTLNATLPDWITLASDGIRFEGPLGATASQPWANYSRWRERGQVILVDRSEGGGFTILPITALSETERQSLRAMLDSSVPTVRA
jgi:hypothetical protein